MADQEVIQAQEPVEKNEEISADAPPATETMPRAEVKAGKEKMIMVKRASTFNDSNSILPPFLGTLYGCLKYSVKRFPRRLMYSQRTMLPDGDIGHYESFTFKQVMSKVKKLAYGLSELGVRNGTRIGIMSPSCMAWGILEYATSAIGALLIPLYESMNVENLLFAIEHSDIEILFASPSVARKLNIALHGKIHTLVLIDTDQRTRKWCDDNKFIFSDETTLTEMNLDELIKSKPTVAYKDSPTKQDIYTLALELVGKGVRVRPMTSLFISKRPENPPHRAKPDDPHTVIYTSGTTGTPKGAIITERNITTSAWGMAVHVEGIFTDAHKGKYPHIIPKLLTPAEKVPELPERPLPPPTAPVVPRYLSFLPMAHIFERTTQVTALLFGLEVCYFSGTIPQLSRDIQEIQPILLVTVPRVLGKFREILEEQVRTMPAIKQKVFNKAVRSQINHLKKGESITRYNKLVFNRIRAQFGNHIQLLIVGGAPAPDGLIDFWMAALDCVSSQGYGMTETTGAVCAYVPGPTWVNQGWCLGSNQLALVDRPDLGYLIRSDKPSGEIVIRGPNVFQGYYKDEERSKLCFLEGGWYRSGDVGRLNPDGSLLLIDRVSSIFKLSQGEFVCAEQLESVYSQSSLISQLLIVGDSTHGELVGIAVPNILALKKSLIKGKGITPPKDVNALLSLHQTHSLIFASLMTKAKAANLAGYEMLRLLILDPTEWTPENGFCTPSLKVRRNVVRDHYAPETAKLYSLPVNVTDQLKSSGEGASVEVERGVYMTVFQERRLGVLIDTSRLTEKSSEVFVKARRPLEEEDLDVVDPSHRSLEDRE